MGSCSGGVEARRTRFNEGCARHTQGQHKYIHYDDILLCEIGCCHGGICRHVVIRALGVFGGPMALGDVRVRSLATDHKGCRAVLVHMDRGTLASAARAFGDEDLFVAFHRIHDGLNVVQWDGLAWRCLPVDRCRAKLPGLASGVGVLRKELAPHVVKQAGHSVNADRFAFGKPVHGDAIPLAEVCCAIHGQAPFSITALQPAPSRLWLPRANCHGPWWLSDSGLVAGWERVR